MLGGREVLRLKSQNFQENSVSIREKRKVLQWEYPFWEEKHGHPGTQGTSKSQVLTTVWSEDPVALHAAVSGDTVVPLNAERSQRPERYG